MFIGLLCCADVGGRIEMSAALKFLTMAKERQSELEDLKTANDRTLEVLQEQQTFHMLAQEQCSELTDSLAKLHSKSNELEQKLARLKTKNYWSQLLLGLVFVAGIACIIYSIFYE